MLTLFHNDLEILLSILIISILIVFMYDLFKNHGKLYFTILKMKVNVQNKNNWSNETTKTNENTKGVEIDFKMELYNYKKNYNSIYNIKLQKKKKFKYEEVENSYLNLKDTVKSSSGTNTYEKLKYINLLPFEVKQYSIIIKLTKEEFENLHYEPIYITYKTKRHWKRIKINKYLRRKKKP